MPSPLPRRNRWLRPSLASPTMTAFPEIRAGRLPHHPFRGLLSVYSCYGLHTRQVPYRTLYTEGFSRFVTSTTAPIATGWSDSCRVGFAPTGRPCLCTAHRIVWASDPDYVGNPLRVNTNGPPSPARRSPPVASRNSSRLSELGSRLHAQAWAAAADSSPSAHICRTALASTQTIQTVLPSH